MRGSVFSRRRATPRQTCKPPAALIASAILALSERLCRLMSVANQEEGEEANQCPEEDQLDQINRIVRCPGVHEGKHQWRRSVASSRRPICNSAHMFLTMPRISYHVLKLYLTSIASQI
jgi:hypothetical protein